MQVSVPCNELGWPEIILKFCCLQNVKIIISLGFPFVTESITYASIENLVGWKEASAYDYDEVD